MAIDQAFFAAWTPRAQAVLRLVTSFLFLQHATAKFFGIPVSFGHIPPLIVTAGCIELVFGTLLLVGLWARAAAFVLSGEMAFAYFMAHASHGNVLSPMLNQGEPAVLYCFIFLFLAAGGPGVWSVDAARRAKV
jgi:putative oxidoreductase